MTGGGGEDPSSGHSYYTRFRTIKHCYTSMVYGILRMIAAEMLYQEVNRALEV